jgi:DNA (cytosine-5)-methyltransferase 1
MPFTLSSAASSMVIIRSPLGIKAVSAFKKNYGDDIPVIAGDICDITDEKIAEYTKGEEVDIIIGGPPCQSFSTVGQRKYDERAKLSNQYLVKTKRF